MSIQRTAQRDAARAIDCPSFFFCRFCPPAVLRCVCWVGSTICHEVSLVLDDAWTPAWFRTRLRGIVAWTDFAGDAVTMPDTAAAVVDDEDAPVRKKSPPPPAKSAKAAKAPADGSSPFGAFVAACSDAGYTWDDDKKVFTFTDEEKLRPHSASSGGDEYTSIAHAVEAINARDHKLKALSDHVAELEKLLDDKRDEVGDKVDAVLAKYQDGAGLEGDKPSDVKENTKPQNAQETKASKNAKAAETKTHVPDKKSKAADSKPPPPASKDGGDTGDEKAAKPTENKKGKPANDDATPSGDNKDASAEAKKLKVVTEATTADATEGDTVEEDAIVKPRKAKSSKTGKSDGSEKTTIKARVEAKLEAQHAGDQESKVNHTKPKRSRSRKVNI